MQLIFESEPRADITINMSTHGECPVNGDMVIDIKKDMIQNNKENTPIEVVTIGDLEKILTGESETENNREIDKTSIASNILTNVVTEESQEKNVKSNENGIEVLAKDDLILENMNTISDENTTSGKNNDLKVVNESNNLIQSTSTAEKCSDTNMKLVNENHILCNENSKASEKINIVADATNVQVTESAEKVDQPLVTEDAIKDSSNNNSNNSIVEKNMNVEAVITEPCETIMKECTSVIQETEVVTTENVSSTNKCKVVSLEEVESSSANDLEKTIKINEKSILPEDDLLEDNSKENVKIALPGNNILKNNELLPKVEEIQMEEMGDKTYAKTLNNVLSCLANEQEFISNAIILDKKIHDVKEPEDIEIDDLENASVCDKITDCIEPACTTKEKTNDTTINSKINALVVGDKVLDNNESSAIKKVEPNNIVTDKKTVVAHETSENYECITIQAEKINELASPNNTTKENQDVHLNSEINTNEENVNLDNSIDLIQEVDRNIADATKPSDAKSLTVIDNDKESENLTMEIDDDDIVEIDKEKADENTITASKKTCSNDLVKKDSNSIEIMEQDLSFEDSLKTNTTEVPSKDLEDKNIAEVKTENNATIMTDDQDKVEILDEDDIKIVENKIEEIVQEVKKSPEKTKELPVVCKLSNTLDILSDDDEEEEPSKTVKETEDTFPEKQCINIDDDDDIMLIEEDSSSKENDSEDNKEEQSNDEVDTQTNTKEENVPKLDKKEPITTEIVELSPRIKEKESPPREIVSDYVPDAEKVSEEDSKKTEKKNLLLPGDFLKSAKKNLADMTRDELEDFCILKIVESIVDRSNLGEIKTKIKTMSQNIEEYRKKALMLTKQNRDLQVVLKSVQEEQKKRSNVSIQPLKITRSVGMQVLMTDKFDARRKGPIPPQAAAGPIPGRPVRNIQKSGNAKSPAIQSIPVPRLVPANGPAKTPANSPANNLGKAATPNGLRNPSPVQKVPEKRTHNRMQASSSVTVDLTDDEPPAKMNNKNASSIAPVRLVPPQNLMAQQRPFGQQLNSPRKVYIPISGPQTTNIRPGQTVMLKTVSPVGPRQRLPSVPRMQQNPLRMNKAVANRHPAPLPDAMKQYTPPTWKALPPAPDLKLSKVENGIVISWKIDGYPDGGYETIASYQIYAYQETASPPSTALWKKIGDVKALPLPMACTLTQFMAGFKYYFAVRAVDIRSRLGPFSLPGSILLLNKV